MITFGADPQPPGSISPMPGTGATPLRTARVTDSTGVRVRTADQARISRRRRARGPDCDRRRFTIALVDRDKSQLLREPARAGARRVRSWLIVPVTVPNK